MAKNDVRVKANTRGAVALLRDAGVQSDLFARGNRIAVAAGDGVIARAAQGQDRGVVFVTTTTEAARRAEAEKRALTRAIDAGR